MARSVTNTPKACRLRWDRSAKREAMVDTWAAGRACYITRHMSHTSRLSHHTRCDTRARVSQRGHTVTHGCPRVSGPSRLFLPTPQSENQSPPPRLFTPATQCCCILLYLSILFIMFVCVFQFGRVLRRGNFTPLPSRPNPTLPLPHKYPLDATIEFQQNSTNLRWVLGAKPYFYHCPGFEEMERGLSVWALGGWGVASAHPL